MISTSILYCNKLDALPTRASESYATESTCSASLTNSGNSAANGRFRVRYLGSTQCSASERKLKDGIGAFQKPLLDLYGTARRRTLSHQNFYPFALNQVLDVCAYGVVVAQTDPILRTNRQQSDATVVTKVITPLSNILLWAAVRFGSRVTEKSHAFGAAFVPLSCSEAVLTNDSFVALASRQRFLLGLPHPPLFVCVLQKVSAPQQLECHMLVCASAEDAISLCALLGDTQRHCSKIGALELPPPGQMGNYSYKSPSKSVADRHASSDSHSDSSRVGVTSVSVSSYKLGQTPAKVRYKFRPHQQLPQQQRQHQQQKRPIERKAQFEAIHTKSLPLFSANNNNNGSPMLELCDYRLRSYRHLDSTPTPTTSSSSDKHYDRHHQRYESRNNCRNGVIAGKRETRKVCTVYDRDRNHHNNSNHHTVNNSDSDRNKRVAKTVPKNAKQCNNNSISRDNSDDNNSSVNHKERAISGDKPTTTTSAAMRECGTSGTSSHSSQPNTRDTVTTNGPVLCSNCHHNYHTDRQRSVQCSAGQRRPANGSRLVADKCHQFNCVRTDSSGVQRRLMGVAKASVHRNANEIHSSDDSVSTREITIKDNPRHAVSGAASATVPNMALKPTQSAVPMRRYFGDTIRGAKSFETLDRSAARPTSVAVVGQKARNESQNFPPEVPPKVYVRVRNATTSCRDAPWITDGKSGTESMVVSETIFLGSESDSKKSSTGSHLSRDSVPETNCAKSWPNLAHRDGDQFGRDITSDRPNNRLRSDYFDENSMHCSRPQSTASGRQLSETNRNALCMRDVKCVKSFNGRANVQQWSTMSSSNPQPSVISNHSAPNFRPEYSRPTAVMPVLKYETLSANVPRVRRPVSHENSHQNRGDILSRLRRMSLRSWLNARRNTSKLLLRFRSSRKRRKRYPNSTNRSIYGPVVSNGNDCAQRDQRSYGEIGGHERRENAWNFRDYAAGYGKYASDKHADRRLSNSSSPTTPSPSFSSDNSAPKSPFVRQLYGHKSGQRNFLTNRANDNNRNGMEMESEASLVDIIAKRKALRATPSSQTKIMANSNAMRTPQTSMSSDSGLEEIDCLSSTDVTNSLNSSRKPLAVQSNVGLVRDRNNEWQNLHCKSQANPFADAMLNKRKPITHWSQTNLEEELGYMP